MGRVRRGIFKMRKTWFKQRNQFTPPQDKGCETTQCIPKPGYVRPTHQQLSLATPKDDQGDFCHTATQMAPESCRNVMLLRPKVVEMTPVDKIQLKSVNLSLIHI